MRRALALLAILAFAAAACTPAATTETGTTTAPQKTGDFKQSKLDIAYSFFSDNSVHLPTSKALLVSALDAMKKEARNSGGTDDVATPTFTDKPEFSLPDFKLFAAAAGALAAKNPQVSADRFAQAGIVGLMAADPDCHTYYLDGRGGVIQSRPEQGRGTAPQIPSGGTPIQAQPDAAGLQAKLLDGGVAYVTWHAFEINGTYKITETVKAVLDKAVTAGAKAFLFDLRGNIGGNGDDVMAAWFLNSGDPMLKVVVRTGSAGIRSAAQGLRLPSSYQLPIAIILNDRGGSAPEVFSASLKENKRATIVGQKSIGCLGGTSSVPLGSDGAQLYVVQQEFVGAVTGAKYNNAGIPPDVTADDTSAVTVATKLLLDKIAGR
jgi:hypothetical protein